MREKRKNQGWSPTPYDLEIIVINLFSINKYNPFCSLLSQFKLRLKMTYLHCEVWKNPLVLLATSQIPLRYLSDLSTQHRLLLQSALTIWRWLTPFGKLVSLGSNGGQLFWLPSNFPLSPTYLDSYCHPLQEVTANPLTFHPRTARSSIIAFWLATSSRFWQVLIVSICRQHI